MIRLHMKYNHCHRYTCHNHNNKTLKQQTNKLLSIHVLSYFHNKYNRIGNHSTIFKYLKFTTNSSSNDLLTNAKQILDYLKERNSQFYKNSKDADQLAKKQNQTQPKKLHNLSMENIDNILYQLSKIKYNPTKTKTNIKESIPPVHDGTEVATLAQSILQEVKSYAMNSSQKFNIFQPKVNHYNSVLECWAKSGGGKTSAQKAETLLYQMLHRPRKKSPRFYSPKPNITSYTLVLETWAKSEVKEAGQKAETIFSKLMRNIPIDTIGPDVYANVIHAWANSHGANNAAERATIILEEMILRAEQSNDPNNMPDTFAFNAVLKAWSNSKNKKLAAKTSLALLHKMEQNMIQFGESSSTMPFYERTKINESHQYLVTPTTASYNYVLDCLVKNADKNTSHKVEAILKRMIQLCNEGYYDKVKPNCYSFNIAITALARSHHTEAATRANELLTIMLDMYKKGDEDLKPDTACFNACIYAWSRCPDKGSAIKAEAILNQLEKWGQKWDTNVRPNTISYSSVITAWARSKETNAGHRAERLLTKMENAFQEGNLDVKPNIITYSAVMDALAKSGTRLAASKAESLMNRLEDFGLKPNLITFNSAISAIGQSDEKNIPQRLDAMITRMESYKLKPDTQTWNTIIMSCIHEKEKFSIEKGESILNNMETQYQNGVPSVKTNATTYTNLMKLYARSKLPDKAICTQKLFLTMKDRYENGENDMRPTISSYITLLQACAHTNGNDTNKQEALMIALNTFQTLDECHYLQPVQVIYCILIDLFENLIDDRNERDQYLQKFFKRCCNEGNLNNYILKALHRSAQSDLWQELTSMKSDIKYYDLNVKNLPSQWSSAQYKKTHKK